MPIVIGGNSIGKNLQRQCCNRLTKVVIPEPIAEGCEKKRCSLATNPSQSEQNPRNNPPGGCLHDDVDDCFPAAHAKRERRFAVTVWHKKNHFLGGAQDEGN